MEKDIAKFRKQAGIIIMYDKVDKKIKKDKESHFIQIKGLHQEGTTI